MCGRFSSTLSAEFIRRLFGTEGDIPNLDRMLWWSAGTRRQALGAWTP